MEEARRERSRSDHTIHVSSSGVVGLRLLIAVSGLREMSSQDLEKSGKCKGKNISHHLIMKFSVSHACAHTHTYTLLVSAWKCGFANALLIPYSLFGVLPCSEYSSETYVCFLVQVLVFHHLDVLQFI